MPLVLTTNEFVPNPDHAWNDVEGVQYHYPNVYKNKVKPGEVFVYYRGVLRKPGPRGEAEYFGHGRIGEITLDPATLGNSRPARFCAIENYEHDAPAHDLRQREGWHPISRHLGFDQFAAQRRRLEPPPGA